VDPEQIRRHYEPLIQPGRPGHEVADWADVAAQQMRFQVLADNVDLAGQRLLDVGCGTGDLLTFLDEHHIAADYFGVDLLDKMVAEAQRRHPRGAFECLNPFEADALAGRTFDVVFASGVFNLDDGRARDFLSVGVTQLRSLATQTLVFNLLHARTANRYPDCIYWDPADVLTAIQPLGVHWRVIEDYLPNDFTVIGQVSD
jgi:SAM-dependent methyltransferase